MEESLNTVPVDTRDVNDSRGDATADASHCLNCDAPLHGPYCSACGQKRAQRISIKGVVANAVQTLLKVDSRFLRTVVGMTLRPGETARAYVEGQRGRYLNPIKYVFFTTTLFLIIINVFDVEVWRLGSQGSDANRESFMLVFGLLAYLVFINVLGVAAVLRLVFRARGRNFAEGYVLGLFCYGHLMLLFITAAFAGAYESYAHYSVVIVGTWLFLSWAVVGFYRTQVWRAALTALCMVIAYYMAGSVMSYVIMFSYYTFTN